MKKELMKWLATLPTAEQKRIALEILDVSSVILGERKERESVDQDARNPKDMAALRVEEERLALRLLTKNELAYCQAEGIPPADFAHKKIDKRKAQTPSQPVSRAQAAKLKRETHGLTPSEKREVAEGLIRTAKALIAEIESAQRHD